MPDQGPTCGSAQGTAGTSPPCFYFFYLRQKTGRNGGAGNVDEVRCPLSRAGAAQLTVVAGRAAVPRARAASNEADTVNFLCVKTYDTRVRRGVSVKMQWYRRRKDLMSTHGAAARVLLVLLPLLLMSAPGADAQSCEVCIPGAGTCVSGGGLPAGQLCDAAVLVSPAPMALRWVRRSSAKMTAAAELPANEAPVVGLSIDSRNRGDLIPILALAADATLWHVDGVLPDAADPDADCGAPTDADTDGDGVDDEFDLCPAVCDPSQQSVASDPGLGAACAWSEAQLVAEVCIESEGTNSCRPSAAAVALTAAHAADRAFVVLPSGAVVRVDGVLTATPGAPAAQHLLLPPSLGVVAAATEPLGGVLYVASSSGTVFDVDAATGAARPLSVAGDFTSLDFAPSISTLTGVSSQGLLRAVCVDDRCDPVVAVDPVDDFTRVALVGRGETSADSFMLGGVRRAALVGSVPWMRVGHVNHISRADFGLSDTSTGLGARGNSMSAIDDVSGDGVPDLVVGDSSEGPGGTVYIFYMSRSGSATAVVSFPGDAAEANGVVLGAGGQEGFDQSSGFGDAVAGMSE